jgi:hypothetical protein
MIDQIGGWSKRSVGEGYGGGVSLCPISYSSYLTAYFLRTEVATFFGKNWKLNRLTHRQLCPQAEAPKIYKPQIQQPERL